jgi:hypothetical protein
MEGVGKHKQPYISFVICNVHNTEASNFSTNSIIPEAYVIHNKSRHLTDYLESKALPFLIVHLGSCTLTYTYYYTYSMQLLYLYVYLYQLLFWYK